MKKLLLALALSLLGIGCAYAQVELNRADQSELDGIKGVGPQMAKAILAERRKSGDFKDWADLEQRVKGIRDKKSSQLSQAGLIINGQSKPAAGGAKDSNVKSAAAMPAAE